jgi:hypothetical protein
MPKLPTLDARLLRDTQSVGTESATAFRVVEARGTQPSRLKFFLAESREVFRKSNDANLPVFKMAYRPGCC